MLSFLPFPPPLAPWPLRPAGLLGGCRERTANRAPCPRAQNPCPKRVAFVREIIQETMGFAPFEKRAMEVLKVGKEKRAQRYCKKRLGTHQRGVKVRLPPPLSRPATPPALPARAPPAKPALRKSPQEKRLRLLNGGLLTCVAVVEQKKEYLSEAMRKMRK